MRILSKILWFIFCLGCCLQSQAQSNSQNAKRYEIDAKRIGIGYTSRDALPRSREFKQIDSTYYVGWMYEGGYRMEHAADALGFRLAAESLQRALNLMEHDFKKELKTRTGDAMTYINIMNIHRDWDFIQYALYQSYAYSNQIEQAWNNLRRASIINLQDELMTETYNLMAWTVHRNRQFTSKEYSFLKNSIAENEAYAHQLLDSSLQKIIRDQTLMESFLAINYRREREPGIWHYRAILYGYALQIQAASKCYDSLQSTAYFPENNYATFQQIQGNFKEADSYYNKSKENEQGEKRLQESYYYSCILSIYQNQISPSIKSLNELVTANGSTPGFGWYQLALARMYLYNGELHKATIALKKASEFHEIHMGTTLGEGHYQLTLSTLSLVRWNRLIQLQHQADEYWWVKPDKLWYSLVWYWKRYQEKMRWINLVKNNPERQQVIYKLFSSESTISFDEVLTCLEGLSPGYFNAVFTNNLQTDTLRPNLIPYWHFAIAKQLMEEKKWVEAKTHLIKSIDFLTKKNDPYLALLEARCYEAIIQCLQKQDLTVPTNYYLTWFKKYPQTIMASNISFPIQCQYSKHPALVNIVKCLQRSNIQLTNNTNFPLLKLESLSQKMPYKIKGEWYLPGESIPFRTFTLNLLSEQPSNEQLFQPLFVNIQ